MFTGGSEMYRTQSGSANQYNVDDKTSHLNWNDLKTNAGHFTFARRIVAFRNDHPGLRPPDWFKGQDNNGNGLKDVTWYRDDGQEADAGYLDAKDRHFLAYRIDATESKMKDPAQSIYVAYNSWSQPITVTLPPAMAGKAWYRAGDTAAWMETDSNFRDAGQEDRLDGRTYDMKGRSILVLVER